MKTIFPVAAALALLLAPLPAPVSGSARAAGRDYANSEPRNEQSEKIACSQSLLQPPGGLDVDCGRYPVSSTHCVKQGYAVESKEGRPSVFVYAMTQGHAGRGCGIAAPQSVRNDMVMAVKKYRPFVRDDATNWSKRPVDLKHAGLALFFDSPDKNRDGKCVAFYQPGPPVVAGAARDSEAADVRYMRQYYYRGWICGAPGQEMTKSQAEDLIKSFTVQGRQFGH